MKIVGKVFFLLSIMVSLHLVSCNNLEACGKYTYDISKVVSLLKPEEKGERLLHIIKEQLKPGKQTPCDGLDHNNIQEACSKEVKTQDNNCHSKLSSFAFGLTKLNLEGLKGAEAINTANRIIKEVDAIKSSCH